MNLSIVQQTSHPINERKINYLGTSNDIKNDFDAVIKPIYEDIKAAPAKEALFNTLLTIGFLPLYGALFVLGHLGKISDSILIVLFIAALMVVIGTLSSGIYRKRLDSKLNKRWRQKINQTSLAKYIFGINPFTNPVNKTIHKRYRQLEIIRKIAEPDATLYQTEARRVPDVDLEYNTTLIPDILFVHERREYRLAYQDIGRDKPNVAYYKFLPVEHPYLDEHDTKGDVADEPNQHQTVG